MADLTPGVYEQLVTKQLQLRLAAIDDALVDRGELDPADAHQILASHLGDLARRALRSVPGDDATAVARQVALANQIAAAIIAIAPDVSNDADLVAETQDLLWAIAAAPEVPGPVRFATRPEVPLSVSALLVNGRDQPRIGVEFRRNSPPLIASTCCVRSSSGTASVFSMSTLNRSSGVGDGCASSPLPT